MRTGRHKGIAGPPRPTWSQSALRTPRLMAFTLIEVMLVVAILIIALAFSYPAIKEAVHREPMTQAVKDVMDACRNARAQAILTGQTTELRVYPQQLRVEVGTVSGDVQPGATDTPAPSSVSVDTIGGGSGPAYNPKNPFAASAQLPNEVRFELVSVYSADFTQDEVARVRFYPNGTSDEMMLILQDGADERRITLESVTALVEIETDATKFNKY